MSIIADFINLQPCQFFEAPPIKRCLITFIRKYGGGGGSGGLTQVYTTNSSTVIFSGLGTSSDPLTADIDTSGIPTIYTANGTITGNRVVTMPNNQSLTFNSTTPSRFLVNLQSSPSSDVVLGASTLGGTSVVSLSALAGTNYLNIGSSGTKLASQFSSVDLSFGGGIKILRGDDNTDTYSRFMMAPGTSTPPTWTDVNSTGGSSISIQAPTSNSTDGVNIASILNTNGYIISERVTPQRFYVNKNILSPSSNVKLFEVNQDGSIYFPTVPNAPSLATDSAGKLIVGSGGGGPLPDNPTALVGLSSVNGSATTYMRSDASPALDQSISPTWTGVHTFILSGGGEVLKFGNNNTILSFYDPTLSTEFGYIRFTNAFGIIGTSGGTPLSIRTNDTDRLIIDLDGTWYVNGDYGANGMVLTSRGLGQTPVWTALPPLPTVNKGIATFVPDNTTTVFNIPHGLGTTPTWYEAFNLTGLSGNYAGRAITVDSTNIIITFANPPTTTDGNASFAWKAEL